MEQKQHLSRRKIGKLEVSSIGYGCMALSHGYGQTPSKEDAIKACRHAYEIGYTFFDTAEAYGNGENEIILGEAVKDIRDKVEIATKLVIHDPNVDLEKYIREHLDASLKRLQMNFVELYYLHRCQDGLNYEEVARVMGKLINEKKIGGWGMSQVSAEIIRKAHAITPLTAIQSEYSLMERMFEKEVLPTCAELGIGFVAFSPLASSFLCGGAKANEKYTGDDVRRAITRFKAENVEKNKPMIDLIEKYGKKLGCTNAQISLSWMMKKYPFCVPIPGPKTLKYIDDNAGADKVNFTDEIFKEFEKELEGIKVYGNRTDEDIIKMGYVHSVQSCIESK